jgi:hypothetical protein
MTQNESFEGIEAWLNEVPPRQRLGVFDTTVWEPGRDKQERQPQSASRGRSDFFFGRWRASARMRRRQWRP